MPAEDAPKATRRTVIWISSFIVAFSFFMVDRDDVFFVIMSSVQHNFSVRVTH